MEYRTLCDVYERLEGTSSSLKKTEILAELFRDANSDRLEMLVRLSHGTLFAPWESEELGVSSNLTQSAISKATGIAEPQVEDWWRDTGDLGNAAAEAIENRTQTTLLQETLSVEEVYETLQSLATFEGAGSQQRRIDTLSELLTNAAPIEARYLVRTVTGAMRLGVGEGTIRDAIAEAFLDGSKEAVDAVERAHQVTNDFGLVAETARERGLAGLSELDVEVFRPVKVMLAEKAETLEDGLNGVAPTPGNVLLEYKYDGIRTQIHHSSGETEVYTRRLEPVTTQFPEVASAAAKQIDAEEFIIEGEIVGYDPDSGRPLPFQELSRRVKRKYDIERLQEEIPVMVHLFDALYVDGESLLEEPLRARVDYIDRILDLESTVLTRAENHSGPDLDAAQEMYHAAQTAGHEGLMTKNLEATYQPGTRVGYMMKVKPTMEPLDLVVVRAKWSEGRKSDFLGRVYLACRDADTGELLEVGRMATGFTDDELETITGKLKPLVRRTDGREVMVDPKVVLEVEYEEIQDSPEYGSGYALRFPRFREFRDDLDVTEIDTLQRVESLFESQ
jgi:DNA ligase-1